MTNFLLALWHGIAIFAIGTVGIFVADVPADWLTLGSAGVLAVCVFVYSWLNPA